MPFPVIYVHIIIRRQVDNRFKLSARIFTGFSGGEVLRVTGNVR